MNKILLVDDDHNILKVLKMRLESDNYLVTTTTNADDAIKVVGNHEFDIALLDLKLAQNSGIELMEILQNIRSEIPVIILTAYGTIASAVEAIKKGAYNYITKPFDYPNILIQINNAIEKKQLSKEIYRLKTILREQHGFKNIITKSEKMKQVLDQVLRVAETDSIVNIQGESGTGKELIAKALHLASPRKKGPFIAFNCAAIPETLFEGELFGFKKGAFTGAINNKKGFFDQAHGGSIFLDEISELSLSMQSKLLRVLEEKKFYPLGSEKPTTVNVRIITASNKDLKNEVKNGSFRNDLFYRIHVVPISLPPLRERKEDIPFLAEHFLEKFVRKMDKNIKGFTTGALKKLIQHSWPGNVRELENVIECAIVMSTTDIINENHFLMTEQEMNNYLKPLREAKNDFEKEYLIKLMEYTHGNITQAAIIAKKYRADLYKILGKYEIKPTNFRKISVANNLH